MNKKSLFLILTVFLIVGSINVFGAFVEYVPASINGSGGNNTALQPFSNIKDRNTATWWQFSHTQSYTNSWFEMHLLNWSYFNLNKTGLYTYDNGAYNIKNMSVWGSNDQTLCENYFKANATSVFLNNSLSGWYNIYNSTNNVVLNATWEFVNIYAYKCYAFNLTNNQSASGGSAIKEAYFYGDNSIITPIPTVTNFTATALNTWDFSSISSFNITMINSTNNYTFGTTTGTITTSIMTDSTSLFNITYFSNTNFNITYYNINVSSSHVGYMNQSIITLFVKEFDSNNTISNFSINISNSIVLNTTGTNGTINPNNGSYTAFIIDNAGQEVYQSANTTFNVAYLDVKNVTLYVFEHTINVTAKDVRTNATITNFTVSLSDLTDGTDTRTFNTTNGTIIIPVVHHYYNVSINASSYALFDNYQLINVTNNTNKIFYLYTTNSISFGIYNLSTLGLFNNSVNIELFGDSHYYNLSTSNGSAYKDNIAIDFYRIYISTLLSGYSPVIFYVTILGGDHYNLNAYFKSSLSSIVFNLKDSSTNYPLPNASMIIYQNINGTKVAYSSCFSDFAGNCNFYLDSTIEYDFIVSKEDYNTQSGKVIPITTPYTISLNPSTDVSVSSVFYDVLYNYSFNQVAGTGTFNYIVSSGSGILEYFGANASYDGTTYSQNTSTSPNGGIITFTINDLDPDSYDSVDVKLWFKASSFDLFTKNLTFSVTNFTLGNYTVLDNLLTNLSEVGGVGFQDNGKRNLQGLKAIMGMFIVSLLILLFNKASGGNITASVIGGIIGFVICYHYELLEKSSVLFMIVLIVLSIIGYELWVSR